MNAIVIDSGCNIPDRGSVAKVRSYVNLIFNNFFVSLKGRLFKDSDLNFGERGILINELFETSHIIGEFPQTSAPSIDSYIEAFKKAKGAQTVCLTLPSVISQAHNNAKLASRGFRNVSVFEAHTTSVGIWYLVEKAALLFNSGLSAQSVCEELKKYMVNIETFLFVDDVSYLAKGGRAANVITGVFSKFKLKLLLTLKSNGFVKISFLRTRRSAIDFVLEIVKSKYDKIERVGLVHNQDLSSIESLSFRLGLLNLPVDKVESSLTLASHTGPKAFGCVICYK